MTYIPSHFAHFPKSQQIFTKPKTFNRIEQRQKSSSWRLVLDLVRTDQKKKKMPSQMILPITNLHPSHSLLEKPNSTYDDDPITITTTTTTTNSLLFEDEKAISIKPLLSRTLSYTNTNTSTTTTSATYYQQRRRRIASENSLSSLSSSSPGRRNSFGHDVGHAASETFLITRLSWKLLKYLGYNLALLALELAVDCLVVSVFIRFNVES